MEKKKKKVKIHYFRVAVPSVDTSDLQRERLFSGKKPKNLAERLLLIR